MAHRTAHLILFSLGAVLAGCDGPKPTGPTAVVTVAALTLSAPPASIKIGTTHQLTATATLSNGQPATSGFVVTWSSSDTKVATVSPAGLLTGKADGRATIVAAAGAVSATVECLVRGGRTFWGYVTMPPPNDLLGIGGARVTVIDGFFAGKSVITFPQGWFAMEDVSGFLNLRVSAPGFEEAQATVDSTQYFPVVATLRPLVARVTDRADWRIPYDAPGRRAQSSLTFTMRTAGQVDLFASGSVNTGDSSSICGELRDEDNRLLWNTIESWQGAGRTTIPLEGGRRYELKVSDCGWKSPALVQSTLIAVHPE